MKGAWLVAFQQHATLEAWLCRPHLAKHDQGCLHSGGHVLRVATQRPGYEHVVPVSTAACGPLQLLAAELPSQRLQLQHCPVAWILKHLACTDTVSSAGLV